MSKLTLRDTPDYQDLLQDVDDALSGQHRKHVLRLLWARLFQEVPAAHLRMQLKEKGCSIDTEDEYTKIVVQVGRSIKYLSDGDSTQGFEDIEKLKRDEDQ